MTTRTPKLKCLKCGKLTITHPQCEFCGKLYHGRKKPKCCDENTIIRRLKKACVICERPFRERKQPGKKPIKAIKRFILQGNWCRKCDLIANREAQILRKKYYKKVKPYKIKINSTKKK